jgi:hypothetical protein
MNDAAERPEYEYLLTGRASDGRTGTAIVKAPSADEAVRQFEDRGYADVVLHTDDNSARLGNYSGTKWLFTPRQMAVAPKKGPFWLALQMAVNLYWLFWPVTIPATAWLVFRTLRWLVFRRADGFPWDLWDVLPAAIVLLPVLLGLFVIHLPQVRAIRRVFRAMGRARWDEVLRLSPHAGPDDRVQQSWRKAQALAGLGRLEEGLAECDKCRDLVPEYLFWVTQSQVYSAARQFKMELEALARAHALAPKNVNVLIAYSDQLLYLHRDVRRARELLAEARRHAVSDYVLPHLLAAEAVADLEEGRAADAAAGLTQAIRQKLPFVRGNPMGVVDVARMRAYRSLAHAALGETAAARREFAWSRPLLAAHGMDDLLRRCKEAVG